MVLDKKIMGELRGLFDLNLYEVNIWVHLLSRGVSTAGELSDLSNVPRSRAYDVLEGLEKKGFVVMKLGKPIQYIAVPPEEVVSRFKNLITKKANEKTTMLDKLKKTDMFNELNNLYDKGIEFYDPTELSGAFRGRQSAYNQMDLMIKKAQTSIKIVTTEKGLIRKVSTMKAVLKKAKKKGVNIKILSPINEDVKQALNELTGIAEHKELKEMKARFMVIDEESILLMLLDDEKTHPNYDIGVWLNSKLFGTALSQMFDKNW